VPKVITDVLGQEKNFSTMGYAFVSGLIDEKRGKENEK
jgi:CRISPR-associated protein Cst1